MASTEILSSVQSLPAKEIPNDSSEFIETEYGSVSLAWYNHQLTEGEIANMLTQIKTAAGKTSRDVFFATWNMREFYCYDPKSSVKDYQIHALLNAAVEIDRLDMVRFIYKRLVYDHKFYALEKVKLSSVYSGEMRDLLVKYSLRFGGDYEDQLGPLRESLGKLVFRMKFDY